MVMERVVRVIRDVVMATLGRVVVVILGDSSI